MYNIKALDNIIDALRQQDKPLGCVSPEQVNATLLFAYAHSVRDEKELLDFDEVIAFDDVQPIADTLRKLGIMEFTISVRQENLIEILSEFQKLSITVKGVGEFTAHRQYLDGHVRDWCFDAMLMKVGVVPQSRAQELCGMWCEAYHKIIEVADAAEEAINNNHYDGEYELEDLKSTLETCDAVIQTIEGY